MSKAPKRFFRLEGKYADLARAELNKFHEDKQQLAQTLENMGGNGSWLGGYGGFVSAIGIDGTPDPKLWRESDTHKSFFAPVRRTKKGRENHETINKLRVHADGRTVTELAKELGLPNSNPFYCMPVGLPDHGPGAIYVDSLVFGTPEIPYLSTPDDSQCLDDKHPLPGMKKGEKFTPPAGLIEMEEWEYVKLTAEWKKDSQRKSEAA